MDTTRTNILDGDSASAEALLSTLPEPKQDCENLMNELRRVSDAAPQLTQLTENPPYRPGPLVKFGTPRMANDQIAHLVAPNACSGQSSNTRATSIPPPCISPGQPRARAIATSRLSAATTENPHNVLWFPQFPMTVAS